MLIPYIRIVRPINIFIIAITQIIFHYLLIVPLLLINGSATSLSHFQFLLLVISTTMIAAGGYIINDIKDIKVDLINKPERVIINNQISRADGLKLYVTLTAFGILIALYLAYSIQLMALGAIHFLSAGLLFFYSTSYKKIFLLGTFIISLITALSIFIVLLFDLNAMSNTVIIKFVIIYSILFMIISNT